MSVVLDEVEVRDVCEFRYGKSLPEHLRRGGDVPVYGSNGVVGYHDEAITSGPTIIIGRKGSFGEVQFSPRSCWPIDTTYYVDATATKADLKWLAWRLAALGLTSLNRAAAVPGLNREDAYRKSLLFPPLPEQRRIAAILDKVDALRAKRRAALQYLDGLAQAIFLDMFGDVSRASDTDAVRVDDVCDIAVGFPFQSAQYSGGENSVRLCRGANVLPGRIDWSDLARWRPDEKIAADSPLWLRPGDVVIAMDRPWISEGFKIAQLSLTDCPALLVQRVARLRAKEGVPSAFIYNLFKQPSFARFCRPTETTIPHISPNEIRSFRFRLPSPTLLSLFSARYQTVVQMIERMSIAYVETNTLFASLQQRAFSGEL